MRDRSLHFILHLFTFKRVRLCEYLITSAIVCKWQILVSLRFSSLTSETLEDRHLANSVTPLSVIYLFFEKFNVWILFMTADKITKLLDKISSSISQPVRLRVIVWLHFLTSFKISPNTLESNLVLEKLIVRSLGMWCETWWSILVSSGRVNLQF